MPLAPRGVRGIRHPRVSRRGRTGEKEKWEGPPAVRRPSQGSVYRRLRLIRSCFDCVSPTLSLCNYVIPISLAHAWSEALSAEDIPMPDETPEITREELRPGLTMIKRRTIKEDGRYLIYFEFERTTQGSGPGPADPTAE